MADHTDHREDTGGGDTGGGAHASGSGHAEGAAPHRVLLLGFDAPDAARNAFEEAAELPGARQAAVLERSADGQLDVPESRIRGAGAPTVGTGIVGGLVGLLAGPMGAFFGWAAGAALGGYAEERRGEDDVAGLIVLGARVQEGTALLVVDLHEAAPEPADALAARYGASLERIAAEDFAEEVREAERRAESGGG